MCARAALGACQWGCEVTIEVQYQPTWLGAVFNLNLTIQAALDWCRKTPGENSILEVYVIKETNRIVATRSWRRDL